MSEQGSSGWLCSRNNATGNVAGLMAALFVNSASQILVQAFREYRHGSAEAA